MRALVLAVVVLAWAGPSGAETRSVTGQMGVLGEWELTAKLAEQVDAGERRWAGPLSMTHIGYCTSDGPEIKSGELRLQLSEPRREVIATLLIDGTECTFRGRLKGLYEGVIRCPDRRDVPLMLSIE